MKKIQISTDQAPKAIGPYAQGIAFGDLIFTSGQLPINPESGELEQGTIEEATHRTVANLQAVLAEAGSDISKILKATVYLADLSNFAAMNAVYNEYFGTTPPARTCFEVAALPLGAIIEIEAIAHK
ncbi:MAG: RidA family protein [Defluviitaleaceae bacterium]|nr:RidA family protein [Defluviitaleaceae bacterium]